MSDFSKFMKLFSMAGAVTAKIPSDGVVGKYLPSKPSGVALAVGGAFGAVPEALQRQTKGQSWLYKHVSTTEGRAGSWWAHVPIDNNGNYAVFGIGTWMAAAPSAPYLGAIMRGTIGTYVDYKHASVTSTGTWAFTGATYAPNGVDCGYSAVAGSTRTWPAVTGHTLVMRTLYQVNGGTMVVAVDGDYFAGANRLPIVTQDLIDAGYFRTNDLGKRYVDSGAKGIQPDRHITIADGLADVAHAVTIDVTGLKWQARDAGGRAYCGGFVGCSAADVGQAAGTAGRVIAHIEPLHDSSNFAASAMVYVPEVEKAAGGAWEFLGQTHSAETLESLRVYVDGVDKSAVAAGTWSQGAAIHLKKISTVASTDAAATPVARLTYDHQFTAYAPVQCVVSWDCQWIIDKRVRSSFVANLVNGIATHEGSGYTSDRWDECAFGSLEFHAAETQIHSDAASFGRVPSDIILMGSTSHKAVAYVALIDQGRSVNSWAKSAPDYVMMKSYTAGYMKAYPSRSTQQLPEVFKAGDRIGGVVGFGLAIVP